MPAKPSVTDASQLAAEPAAEAGLSKSLPGRDYWSPETFQLERENIFYNKWVCVGREEQLPEAGDFVVRKVMDESILLLRRKTGQLRAFYNVCRHRGSRLCDAPHGKLRGSIKCPYHAWVYSDDGQLIGTPHIRNVENFDRADYSLHSVAVDTWYGFIFVNLAENPLPLLEQVDSHAQSFDRYRIGDLRVGKRIEYDVAANWKIIAENFMECLHCPLVHPELVRIVPIYREGRVVSEDESLGSRMKDGCTTFSRTGTSDLPSLPGLSERDRAHYYGFMVFPNLILNLHSDHVMSYILEEITPDHTKVICEFLFEESSISADDFDPGPVVEFWDLVSRQDWTACERVQKGVRSRAYKHGVYPPQDSYVFDFNQVYLRERDGVA